MSQIGFNAANVPPQVGFVAAPKGKYQVIISESKIEPTKDGSGEIIQWSFVAQGGNYHGRTISLNTTWKHNNPKAVEIGHGQLSAICHAVGVINPQDTQQLHNRPFFLEIDVTPDGKYNQLVDIKPISNGGAPAAAAPATVANPYGAPADPAPALAPVAPAAAAAPVPYVAPAAPAPAPAPAPVIPFPPLPWVAHPHAPGQFWNQQTNQVLSTEQELRQLLGLTAAPASVAAAPAPVTTGPPATLEGAETPSWIANQMAGHAAPPNA